MSESLDWNGWDKWVDQKGKSLGTIANSKMNLGTIRTIVPQLTPLKGMVYGIIKLDVLGTI